jgi:sigma-E factor negative regulatory protein RseC
MCVSSESQEKIIEAIPLEVLQPGDRVTVSVHEYLAWKATLLGYIMPFVVMILVIIVLNALTSLDETITGTLSLCSIAVYYLILRLFRNKLQKQFSITAQKEL